MKNSRLMMKIVLRSQLGVDLPPFGEYATGILFLDSITHFQAEKHFETIAEENGLKVLCWRDVPSNPKCIGEVAKSNEPLMRHVFVVPNGNEGQFDQNEFKRKVNLNIIDFCSSGSAMDGKSVKAFQS